MEVQEVLVPRCQLNPENSPILLQTSHDRLIQRYPLQRVTGLVL